MSQPFIGFVGPSYQLADRYASIERTVNWHLTANEAAGEESKFRLALEPAPGNQPFGTLPVPAPFNKPNRGLLELRGHTLGVNGNIVFEIDHTGTYRAIGHILDDGKPCCMVANGNRQVFITSAGKGYVLPYVVPTGWISVVGPVCDASYATFQDGYIIVITPNSNQFQISGNDNTPLGDATIWNAANVSVQAGQADLLVAAVSSREYLRLFGARRSQIYQDVGSAGIGAFPFQSYNETFIETGCGAPFSIVDMVESLMWIGEDARGQRACWRDTAFQPQRVSTFAIEQIWQSYVSVADAVAFPYIWNGHLIYRITFPSAYESAVRCPVDALTGAFTAATWEYDATVSALLGRHVWCERAYQTAMGYSVGRPDLFHCYCFGKQLVGSGGADGNPGAIYQMGQAPTTNLDPQILLRWSDDGGNTWGIEHNIPIGLQGNYAQRIYWNRCGYARDRGFWVRYAEESECGTDITGAQARQAVVRDRIAPHVWLGNKRRIYNRFELESSRGIGASGAAGPFTFGIVNAMLDVTECAS